MRLSSCDADWPRREVRVGRMRMDTKMSPLHMMMAINSMTSLLPYRGLMFVDGAQWRDLQTYRQ